MNFSRAIGFWAMGWIFEHLPHWAPAWFLTSRADGWSTRQLWLQLMSVVLIGIAAGYFLRWAAGLAAKLLRYHPRPATGVSTVTARPAYIWKRPLLASRRFPAVRQATRPRLQLPLALRTPLLDQRRAA